jgi:phosphoglycolate phosphatase
MDLDGTLEDSRRDMAEAVVRVRAALHLLPGEPAAYEAHVNRGMEALYRTCFADYLARGGPELLQAVQSAYEADYLANVAVHTRLYPGIAEAVAGLARRGPIVIITNKPERISWALLERLGLAPAISDVIGGDTCPEGKPSPAPLRLALSRRGDATAGVRAVMIGDSPADLRAGRAFGAATIWCAWGYAAAPDPERPDHVASTPGELVPLCERVL